MLIEDQVRKCVLFVGFRKPDGDIDFRGTAFLCCRQLDKRNLFLYVVTAAHVIQKIQTVENFDGSVVLRINKRDGSAESIVSATSDWLFHPEDSGVDVAVLRIQIPDPGEYDFRALPLEMFLSPSVVEQEQIGIGDEVYLTGLFYNHSGKRRNIPIARIGNIAAMPEERIRTREFGFIEAYLVEARSIGGLSGSPVFVYISNIDRVGKEGQVLISGKGRGGGKSYLLGLMHGHWDADALNADHLTESEQRREMVNMGIAIVVPSSKVLEVIEQPAIRNAELATESKLALKEK